MKLYHLANISDALEPMSHEAIERRMKHCRRNNDERNIAGLLMTLLRDFGNQLPASDGTRNAAA